MRLFRPGASKLKVMLPLRTENLARIVGAPTRSRFFASIKQDVLAGDFRSAAIDKLMREWGGDGDPSSVTNM